MLVRRVSVRAVCAGVLTLALTLPVAADSTVVRPVANAGPAFGIAADTGSQLIADAGAGIVRLRHLKTELVAALPGVTDVAPINPFTQLAVTGGDGPAPTRARLFRIVRGHVTQIADLGAYEASVNPDGAEINPNPFDVHALPNGDALVADAGANALLIVDKNGAIDWVATLPNEPVSTANVKLLANCPAGPPNICNLPPMIPAQPVTPSVAVGPDGAYYVGELKGFPAPTGASKVWRINPSARHAKCGVSPDCAVVASGFTSIIDLSFGAKGTLYVTELDEASWFAVEVMGIPLGGTVNACDRLGSVWACAPLATGLTTPTAASSDETGRVYVTTHALEPGGAEVLTIRP